MRRHNFQNMNFNQLGVFLISLFMILIPGTMFAKGQKQPRITRQQLRKMVKNLAQEKDTELRKAKIREIYETYGKPWLKVVTKNTQYQPPGQQGPTTKEYVFKRVPQRQLKIFVDFPPGWKPTDRRAAIVFWHGGGFTQGNAGQFFHQAQYFTKRGLVVARPEYRIRDLDGSLPHEAAEDGISAMRWFKAKAGEFGIDPKRVAAGGGSTGGCMASIVGTIDYKQFTELGYVGKQDDRSISPRPCAMILYNPFVDFFEPLNDRHLWEECVMLSRDPFELEPVYHVISGIEHLDEQSPPSTIMFGTKDAFYVQQLRWIVKCRQLGLTCRDYVYKGEVHSWYNNSPHLEYTTDNVNKFLVEIGFLDAEPAVELPHKQISPGRSEIQDAKYGGKKDWDEMPKYQQYVKDHNIKLISFKHYEKQPERPSKPLPGPLARQDRNKDGKLQADEIPDRLRDKILRQLDKDNNRILEGSEIAALIRRLRPEPETKPASVPQPGPSEQIREVNDIEYVSSAGYDKDQGKLDLYLPKGRNDFPVLFCIHGGGLTGGDKSKLTGVGRRFAMEGFGVATVNYRLSPRVQYPAHVEDMAAAFKWVYRRIGEYGGDRNRIFVMGGSAGGHLTALLALDERFLKAHGLSSRNIRGFIPISGLMDVEQASDARIGVVWEDNPRILKSSSPISYVREEAPPMLILYAEHDKPERRAQNDRMFRAMKQAGHRNVSLHELKDRTHTSIRPNLVRQEDRGSQLMLEFMKKHGAGNVPLK